MAGSQVHRGAAPPILTAAHCASVDFIEALHFYCINALRRRFGGFGVQSLACEGRDLLSALAGAAANRAEILQVWTSH